MSLQVITHQKITLYLIVKQHWENTTRLFLQASRSPGVLHVPFLVLLFHVHDNSMLGLPHIVLLSVLLVSFHLQLRGNQTLSYALKGLAAQCIDLPWSSHSANISSGRRHILKTSEVALTSRFGGFIDLSWSTSPRWILYSPAGSGIVLKATGS